jgi:hypothetical protein
VTPPEVSRPVCEICDRPLGLRDELESHRCELGRCHEGCCPVCNPQKDPDQ